MNKLNQKEINLLTLVAMLLALNFIVVPLTEWQDQQLMQISLNEKRLTKLEELLQAKPDLLKVNQEVKARLLQVDDKIPTINVSKFKIEIQKNISSILETKNIKIESASWQNAPEQTGIFELTFEFNATGKIQDVLAAHMALEQAYPNANISDLQLNISRHLAKSLGTGRLQVDLTFLVKTTGDAL